MAGPQIALVKVLAEVPGGEPLVAHDQHLPGRRARWRAANSALIVSRPSASAASAPARSLDPSRQVVTVPPAVGEATRSGLMLQGFACDADSRIAAAAQWLRFTPALSALCIIVGTALRSPALLWGFAVVAAIGALGWHPFDAFFNAVVRRWVHAPALPANPAPRRFAMAVAAAWSAGTGWLMTVGHDWAGIAAGSVLAVAALTVATTHFCLGSWMYRVLGGRAAGEVAT